MDELAGLEVEIKRCEEEIERRRNPIYFGDGYLPVEEQYRRAWYPAKDEAKDDQEKIPEPAENEQLKRLYRRLARQFHPDLAIDQSDKAYRHDRMAALNDAYAAGNMVELLTLSEHGPFTSSPDRVRTETMDRLIEAVEKEIGRTRQQLLRLEHRATTLHHHPTVELSLEIKLAERDGRDLLTEMALDLRKRIRVSRLKLENLERKLAGLRADDQ